MTVAAGDIAFVAFNFDNATAGGQSEGFAFVVLRPIINGDSIRFVDGNWSGSAFNGLDGEIVWTNSSGAAIQPGTVIQVDVGGTGALTGLTPTTNLGSISGKSGSWDVETSDSLYAVSTTTIGATAPGAFAAAVTWGDDDALGTAGTGASVVDFDHTNNNGYNGADTAVINLTTINTTYTSTDLARTGYTTAGNWLRDDADNQSNADTTITNDAEWPSLTDPNSPLYNRFNLAVENVPPAVTSITASGTGITAGNGAVNAGDVVTLTVNLGEAATVTGTPTLALSGGGTATYTATGSTATALNFTYTVVAGQNTADLTVTGITGTIKDAAGNALSFTAATAGNPAGTLVVDTTAPTAPAAAPVGGATADNVGAVQGTLANNAVTDDTMPTLTVGLTGTGAVAGDTVTLLSNGVAVGSVTLTAAHITAGSVAVTPTSGLAEGARALTATVTDVAGNVSAASAALNLTIDTTAPTATTSIGFTTDTGTAGDGITSGKALSGTTTSGIAGETVVIRDGNAEIGTVTTTAGGAWTFANGTATDGAHIYSAAVRDAAGNTGGFTATNPASSTVDTQADTGVVVDLLDAKVFLNTASVSLTVSGLDAGSSAVVTFTGSAGGEVTRVFTTNATHDANVSGLQGDVTAKVQVIDQAGNQSDGSGETLAADPVCFCAGTLIATPGGEVPVEALMIGDLVLTSEGEARPVRWLGRQAVSTRFADPLRVLPIRIRAGALGENLPVRDLLVSPCHALLLDGVLVQAGALVNGRSITRESGAPRSFTYYHVELADHALVLAEGVPAETFVDNVDRLGFDNWAEHEALYGREVPVAEMALPRAKAARQVPVATRARLEARAEALLGRETAAA